MSASRPLRAGDAVEDYCRACKLDRQHTVVAADAEGRPIRVRCGYCGSEHNFRGGGRMDAPGAAPATPARVISETRDVPRPSTPSAARQPFPIVAERERIAPPVTLPNSTQDLEHLLRRIIREETGITPVAPAEKWRGGELVLRPGTPGVQEKTWPIETFFHKVVMLRNRLRTLEQQLNASELPDDAKVRLQAYISGCYGSLTSFNVLFADAADQFKGTSTD